MYYNNTKITVTIKTVLLTRHSRCIQTQSRNSTGPEPEHSFHRSRNPDIDGGPQWKSFQKNPVPAFSMQREKQIGFSFKLLHEDAIISVLPVFFLFLFFCPSSWDGCSMNRGKLCSIFNVHTVKWGDPAPPQLHASPANRCLTQCR